MNPKNRIEVIPGDITLVKASAIVNAANSTLLGGGGVDGAIHKAAGPQLLHECKELNGCAVGDAKITRGYRLKADYIIHTVGPMWKGGINDEHALLALCYRSCMRLAADKKLESIAFPAISTGVYRFPIEEAGMIAITEIVRFLEKEKYPLRVYLVAFSDLQQKVYNQYLGR